MKKLNEESKGCEECRYNHGGKCSVYIYKNGWHTRNEPEDPARGCDMWEKKRK